MPSEYDSAQVVRQPLNESDRLIAAIARSEHRRFRFWAFLLAIGFAAGGFFMFHQGHTEDAIAGWGASLLMLICGVGFVRASSRDTHLAAKEVITGVIRKRIRVALTDNARYALNVGGIEVAVPPAIYTRFREGQIVQVERLCGSFTFLQIQLLIDPPFDPDIDP